MNKLNIFYNPKQNVENNNSFSPSAGKPSLFVNEIKELNSVKIVSDFEPVTRNQIKLVHDTSYVDNVLDLKTPNGFGNKLREVANSLPWTSGSFLAAARYAWNHKTFAMSPTSGFHHAYYAGGGGFCTFNGLMIAAINLIEEKLVRNVLIIDFDYHYGDGTENIIQRLSGKFPGYVNQISSSMVSDCFEDEVFSPSKLTKEMVRYFEPLEQDTFPDIIFYQAGADMHIEDPLGGLLNNYELVLRDQIVFKIAKSYGIPIVWNLAGGYQTPIKKVLDIHKNTLNECISIMNS